jgi:hypothetical protein
MKKHPLLIPVQDVRCHCGNVTSSGIGHATPAREGRKPCCILCRCDECDGAIRPSDPVVPSCGPMCVFHDESIRKLRVVAAEKHTQDKLPSLDAMQHWHNAVDQLADELIMFHVEAV